MRSPSPSAPPARLNGSRRRSATGEVTSSNSPSAKRSCGPTRAIPMRSVRRSIRHRTCGGCSCRSPGSRTSSTTSTTSTRGRAARASTPSRSPRWRWRSAVAGLRNVGQYAQATDVVGPGRPQSARRPRHDPRRRRDHRVTRPAAPAVGLPHHGRPQPCPAHGRRRRRPRVGSLRRRAARRRSGRAGAGADPRDRRAVRARRVRDDGGPRVDRERGARSSHHHRSPRRSAADAARSVAPGSTSPIPSRCRTGTRSGRLPNCIITPHVGNTPEMAKPLLATASDGERPSVSQGRGAARASSTSKRATERTRRGRRHSRGRAAVISEAVTDPNHVRRAREYPATRRSAQIREAYRERARLAHPDRRSGGQTEPSGSGRERSMAEHQRGVPGAARPWPARGLRRHPAQRRLGRSIADSHRLVAFDRRDDDGVVRDTSTRPTGQRGAIHPSQIGPARVPWRMLLLCAARSRCVGVIVLAQFTEPGEPAAPDGILHVGDCVVLEANADAREVVCRHDEADPVDLVVRAFVPFGATCPGPDRASPRPSGDGHRLHRSG